VQFFDERFTSHQAEEALLAAQMTKKGRKRRLDMLAAQIMLSAFLESPDGASKAPGALDDNP
jgi:putative Holliday junction resolvase